MTEVPPWPRWLGLAGLLPQLASLLALWIGPAEWRAPALFIGWAYAALILSFLGGMWWGIAASRMREGERVPGWLWLAAVAPSLIALASGLPFALGAPRPKLSLAVLGGALIASLLIDRRIAPSGPSWWMRLRVPLSCGLGAASLAMAIT